ncbi:MAG TPA: DUF4859 domain-containing protein [Bacteroidales bacterium]|nr:DUF4859 domain-containing protein [Bacteroidales bacterium]
MKKSIFPALVFIAIIISFFAACEKDDVTGRHQYTDEELAEKRRQDSLRQIIPADYVFTQDVVLPYSDNWEPVTINLVQGKDTAKLLELFEYASTPELVAALGTLEGNPPDLVQTGNDITFYAYNWSTKYEVNDPSSTNNLGHWFDANGDVTTWGNGQILYCEKLEGSTLEFNIGHLPGGLAVGDKFSIVEAMKYDTTSVAFVFNITIADEKPLVYPVTTLEGTSTYDIEAELNNDYTATPVEIDAAAIAAAIGIAPGDAEVYGINATTDSLYILGSTAEAPGYWFNTLGDVCNWGDTLCGLYANYIIADELFNIGQFPDGVTAGETYTVKIAFVNLDNLKQYNVVIHVTITGAPVVYPETTIEGTSTYDITVDKNNDYVATPVEIDSLAIAEAIGIAPGDADIYGIDASTDSLYIAGSTAEAPGYWFNTTGDVCNWGDDGCGLYANYIIADALFNVGQYPDGVTPGETYTVKIAFVNPDNLKEYDVIINVTIANPAR